MKKTRFLLLAVLLLTACQHQPEPQPSLPADQLVILPGNAFPNDFALAKDGALWVSESGIGALARVDSSGNIRQYPLGSGPGTGPSRILQGPDSQIWASNGFQITRVDNTGEVSGLIPGQENPMLFPGAMTIGPDGAVWCTRASAPKASILRLQPDQRPTVVASFPLDNLTLPGITTGPDGALWFTESPILSAPEIIGRVGTDGRYTTWPLPTGTGAMRIVTGADKALWFTEATGIGRITVDGALKHYPVPGNQRVAGLTPGPGQALWFTTDTQLGRITTDGKITLWPVPGAKSLLAILPAEQGAFWLSDVKDHVLHRFTPPPEPQ